MKKVKVFLVTMILVSALAFGTIAEWTPEGSYFMTGPDVKGFEIWVISDSPSWHPDGTYKVKEIVKNGVSYGVVKYPCAWPLSYPNEKAKKPTVEKMLKWIIANMCMIYRLPRPF